MIIVSVYLIIVSCMCIFFSGGQSAEGRIFLFSIFVYTTIEGVCGIRP